jgi:hypothetical protein
MWFTQDSNGTVVEALIGRRIVATEIVDDSYGATRGTLTLDNGVVLEVEANEGGCSCGAGDYFLRSANTVDNVITNALVTATPTDPDDEWNEDWAYSIFVFTAHEALAAIEIDGSDGNGYYGTGFSLRVREA